MYKVGFGSADLLRMSLVMAAAMLAICLLALVETTNKAEAKDSLPENGKIAFNHEGALYTVEPDGSNPRQLINETDLSDTGVARLLTDRLGRQTGRR